MNRAFLEGFYGSAHIPFPLNTTNKLQHPRMVSPPGAHRRTERNASYKPLRAPIRNPILKRASILPLRTEAHRAPLTPSQGPSAPDPMPRHGPQPPLLPAPPKSSKTTPKTQGRGIPPLNNVDHHPPPAPTRLFHSSACLPQSHLISHSPPNFQKLSK